MFSSAFSDKPLVNKVFQANVLFGKQATFLCRYTDKRSTYRPPFVRRIATFNFNRKNPSNSHLIPARHAQPHANRSVRRDNQGNKFPHRRSHAHHAKTNHEASCRLRRPCRIRRRLCPCRQAGACVLVYCVLCLYVIVCMRVSVCVCMCVCVEKNGCRCCCGRCCRRYYRRHRHYDVDDVVVVLGG